MKVIKVACSICPSRHRIVGHHVGAFGVHRLLEDHHPMTVDHDGGWWITHLASGYAVEVPYGTAYRTAKAIARALSASDIAWDFIIPPPEDDPRWKRATEIRNRILNEALGTITKKGSGGHGLVKTRTRR